MKLPPPSTTGNISVEKAIKARRSVRSFTGRSLKLEQLSRVLWAAQGITEDRGFKRAAPSGGALYPMDIYAVAGTETVQDLSAGVYHYLPENHSVSTVTEGDLRDEVAQAALYQMWIAQAPVILVITSEYDRITIKYGTRGIRYAIIESGHIGQNIFLQAEALGLGAGIVGAFHDEQLAGVMKIPPSHEPMLIMPVGHKVKAGSGDV